MLFIQKLYAESFMIKNQKFNFLLKKKILAVLIAVVGNNVYHKVQHQIF